MEAMGAFFDEEWDSLSKIFFSEDADLMFQLNGKGNLVIPNHESVTTGSFLAAAPSFFWPSSNGGNYNENVDVINDILDYNNFYNISQESSNSSTSSASEGVFVNPTQEFDHQTNYDYINLLQVTNDSSDQSMDFCNLMDQRNIISSFINLDNVMEDIIICPRDDEMEIEKRVNAEIQQPAKSVDESVVMKRKFQTEAEEKTNDESSSNPKRKSRVARNAPKAKRNVQPKSKKRQKAKEISNEEEEPNMNGQSSCSYNSEDDSNASQESNGGETSDTKAPAAAALNLNGKARATRGAATDPQSLYARRRRERINERLRILQNLIPNGTKVDISTMLEEAVQYVKFMQLQIKLLSSDDKWMYAPIVYNGFDISLFGKIFPTL